MKQKRHLSDMLSEKQSDKGINSLMTSDEAGSRMIDDLEKAKESVSKAAKTFIESSPLGKSMDLINKFIDNNPHKRQSELPYPEVGIANTPLIRAVKHLLKIGSTDEAELQQLAAEFVTEKAACEKLGFSYYDWAWNNFHGDYSDLVDSGKIIGRIFLRKDIFEDLTHAHASTGHMRIEVEGFSCFNKIIEMTTQKENWLFEVLNN